MASEAQRQEVQEGRQLLAAERSKMDQLQVRISGIIVTVTHNTGLLVAIAYHCEGGCNSLAPEAYVFVCSWADLQWVTCHCRGCFRLSFQS